MNSRTPRTYDIVLFGATGFTGRLVAEYLAGHGPQDLRWALAGRDEKKLLALRAELALRWPAMAEVPILIADSQDRAALLALAQKTQVVCTTVGPYARYGRMLVEVCATQGTDYCDLTGEVPFIRDMIDSYQAEAQKSGARIVHCCGFDSIPSDLGVFMLHQRAKEREATLRSVRFYVTAASGGFSGGTVASMINILEEAAGNKALRRILGNPYALNEKGCVGPDGSDQKSLRYDRELGRFTAPFVMAAINTRIVRRSNELLGYPYGRDFSYSEAMAMPKGIMGPVYGAGMVMGLMAFIAAMASPLRGPIKRLLPQPGQGPNEAKRRAGHFRILLLGQASRPDGTSLALKGHIRGPGDPGYSETAKMLGEAALCLAKDWDQDRGPGGILTPASAMGDKLLNRLRRADQTYTVEG